MSPSDPDVQALAASVREHGVREPLVVSLDDYILSGHRRRVACLLAKVDMVPVRVESVSRAGDRFLELLREYNRQRVKSFDEVMREETLSVDPQEAHRVLVEHRKARSEVEVQTIAIQGHKRRARISKAKQPFLEAALTIIQERRAFWPLSDRAIHYALLNDPPLRHASKPQSRYENHRNSYQDLTDLLTRARLVGAVPWAAIEDETRPVTLWTVYDHVGAFVRSHLDDLFKGYYRNLLVSQPNHIEVIGEKNTIEGTIRGVCADYCIPTTIGRGYCSIPPRHKMAQRFRKSGKDKLVLPVLSDFDPEGEDIGHSFARSMRDDFGIANIVPVKVALTAEQVKSMRLPPQMQVKKKGSRAKKFTDQHGTNVFELEALPPQELQRLLREAVDSVLDVEAFNREVEREKAEAARLEGIRRHLGESISAAIREWQQENPDKAGFGGEEDCE